jgi:hypothetical protein
MVLVGKFVYRAVIQKIRYSVNLKSIFAYKTCPISPKTLQVFFLCVRDSSENALS